MRIFLVFAILAVFAFTQVFTKNTPTPPAPIEITNEAATTNSEVSTVLAVIDGDTIELTSGKRVRLVGIDAPEMQGCFANEAKEEVVRLVSQKTIRLEKDISDVDKYGRLLRYIYVDNLFLDDHLVRQGFARVMGIPPDTKFYGQLKVAEQEAREQKRGLWGTCPS